MKKCEMATTSPSVSELTAFKKISKGKRDNKKAKKEVKTLTTKKKLKTLPKESNTSELSYRSKSLVSPVPESSVPEAVWEIEYSEPVPDLYPELSDSLKMEDSDTEHEERAKVCESQSGSEENVQCVPTSFDDNHFSQDSHNNPGTSQQSQNDSQQSNSNNQTTLNNSKRKRKLAKPKKIRKGNDADNVQDTIAENSKQVGQAQDTEKQGTWAQCSIPTCGKWRFLRNDVDPQELPERWVCSMNENDDYNTCSVSQETFDSQEGNLDVMYTPYPSGAVVWAKMLGYPWWPAMMENDPDYGYYCETGEDNVTPITYHVVFFDKQVSRAWVNAACIRNFSCDDDPDDMGKITVRGKNYRRQLTTATLAARSATQMPLQTRLSEFGFAARYKGSIGDKAKKKERLANLEVEDELIDSVTDSSSQEICSSGNSYNSAEDITQVKPKTTPKPKTSKTKITNKPTKRKAKSEESGSNSLEKETGKKKGKAKASTSKASVITSSNNNEKLSDNDHGVCTEIGETIHETERIKKQDDETLVVTTEHEPPVTRVSTVDTDSAGAIPTDEKSICKATSTKSRKTSFNSAEAIPTDEKRIFKAINTKPCKTSDENSSVKKSTGTKVVKKRQSTTESQSGKKREMPNDLENSLTEAKQKELERDNASAVISMESWSSKAKEKNQNVIENSKQSVRNVEEIQANSEGKRGSENSSKLSTASEFQLGVPVQKQDGKMSRKPKNISQDNTVEEDSPMKKPKIQIAKCNGEGTSSSDVLAQNGECEHQRIPKNSGFALKRSAASTDVRVTLDEDSLARKKSLPKLVKAVFKPPVATKGDNNGKARAKMPKLLKPNFVSPTLVKPDSNHDVPKDAREEKMPKSVASSDTFERKTAPKKKLSLKRKAQCKNQYSAGSASRKAKEATSCQEDLQAEIDEIDDDIASMRKELRVSDASDTSLPEEMITSSVAEQQIALSDSPEF